MPSAAIDPEPLIESVTLCVFVCVCVLCLQITSSDDKKVLVWDYGIPVPIKYISEPGMHSMPKTQVHPNGQQWVRLAVAASKEPVAGLSLMTDMCYLVIIHSLGWSLHGQYHHCLRCRAAFRPKTQEEVQRLVDG